MSTQTDVGGVPSWTLPDRLRKAREHRGLSQAQLAEVTGISRRTISAYEGGATEPRRPQVLAWAMATGVPVAWLLTGAESPRQDGPGGGATLPRLDSNQQPSGYAEGLVRTLVPLRQAA